MFGALVWIPAVVAASIPSTDQPFGSPTAVADLLAIDGVVDGAVSTAGEVVAVSYRVPGPDGSTAGVVRYFDALTVTDSGGAP